MLTDEPWANAPTYKFCRNYSLISNVSDEVFNQIVQACLNRLTELQANFEFPLFKDFCGTKIDEHKSAISFRLECKPMGILGVAPVATHKVLAQMVPVTDKACIRNILIDIPKGRALLCRIEDFTTSSPIKYASVLILPTAEVERLVVEIEKQYDDTTKAAPTWNDTLENIFIDMLLAYDTRSPENPYPQKYPLIQRVISDHLTSHP